MCAVYVLATDKKGPTVKKYDVKRRAELASATIYSAGDESPQPEARPSYPTRMQPSNRRVQLCAGNGRTKKRKGALRRIVFAWRGRVRG